MKPPLSLHGTQGLVAGIALTSLGVAFLKAAGRVTRQTAGPAGLLSYLLPLDFGALFIPVSLPFFWLSRKRCWAAFTVRTAIAVFGISAVTQQLGRAISFDALDVLPGASQQGKIGLDLGVYRGAEGRTPVMAAVKARLLETQDIKGDAVFLQERGRPVLVPLPFDGVQTPGGTGAPSLAAARAASGPGFRPSSR
ncbi:hypothetical protein [Poseidonocella sp. HB161398]|uniref:hypothetical protein n=1 Tax=Poseidonocella sp. HB161398 TaxID=2320855 RepID=UPI001107D1F0|nr:hypothetical protein [Poseidonocella sp. HB161398]